MPRMLGRLHPSWCPACHTPPGPDCPDRGKTARQAKRAEQRQWQDETHNALTSSESPSLTDGQDS